MAEYTKLPTLSIFLIHQPCLNGKITEMCELDAIQIQCLHCRHLNPQ